MSGKHSGDYLHLSREINEQQKAFFEENGYLILESFFERERVAKLKRHIDLLWSNRATSFPVAIDALDQRANPERLYFCDVASEARGTPYKLLDLHLCDDLIQDLAADASLLQVIGNVLSARPVVCNTLLFERGSQQPAHFDTFFMPSATPNKMCATWIAIDPVTEANGPLFYYPGSHLIEPFRFSHGRIDAVPEELGEAAEHIQKIIAEHGLKEVRFFPKPGDVLIWHAQLLHGGSPIKNMNETRTSLVTHYWTTIDVSDAANWIDLGSDRLLLRREHQKVFTRMDEGSIDTFVAGLHPSAEDLADLPADFDPRAYLRRNPDVLRAGANPYHHYRKYGRAEGRGW